MIDLHILENDVTQHFQGGWLKERGIDTATEIYLVHEPTCRVHICSFDPSLEAFYVGIRYAGEGVSGTDVEREKVWEELRDAAWDGPEVEYFHYRSTHPKLQAFDSFDEDSVAEAIEAAREFMMGNGYVD